MTLKSTLDDIKSRLTALLTYANGVTGESDTSIGDAIETLADGYGQGGQEPYYSTSGQLYFENMVIPTEYTGNLCPIYRYCPNLKTFEAPNIQITSASATYQIANNSNLERLILPKWVKIGNYNFSFNPKLSYCELGSIGNPVTALSSGTVFRDDGRRTVDLTIVVYVQAESLANVPSTMTSSQPWGATRATVVYKSSTTGNILQ